MCGVGTSAARDGPTPYRAHYQGEVIALIPMQADPCEIGWGIRHIASLIHQDSGVKV